MHKNLLLFRRFLLRHLVPELYWPRESVLDGVSITIRNQPWSYGTKWLLKKGGYELEERLLLADVLKPGIQVLEMGSSIGILSAIVAEKIGSNGRLVAIEASQKLNKDASTFLAKYPWVTVVTGFAFPVLKANRVRIDSFSEVRGNLGGTVSFSKGYLTDPSQKDATIFDISTIYQQFSIEPELLIVDVEGSECLIAQTKPDFPASIRTILMEMHPGLYPNGNDDLSAILRAIQSEGFRQVNELRGVYLFKRV